MRKLSILFSVALGIMISAVVPAAGATHNPPPPPPPGPGPMCTLYASAPVRQGMMLTSEGGRIGCDNTATVSVLILAEQRDQAPRKLGELSQSGRDVKLKPVAPCNSGRPITVYTRVTSSAGSVYESPRSSFPAC